MIRILYLEQHDASVNASDSAHVLCVELDLGGLQVLTDPLWI